MRPITVICLTLAAVLPSAARADATIHYQSTLTAGTGIPPSMEKALTAAAGKSTSTYIRIRGTQACSATESSRSIIDLNKQEMTVLDTVNKTYATLPAAEFVDKLTGAMPAVPADQADAVKKVMEMIHFDVDSKATGRTDTIQNVGVEEREITLLMTLTLPAGAKTTGPAMRVVMQMWTAKPGEAILVPAIRELTGLSLWQKYFLNPSGGLDAIGKMAPGLTDKLTPLLDAIYKGQGIIMRTHSEMYMPMLAALQGSSADPNAPMLQINQEVTDLSDAPVDAAYCAIPKDFTLTAPEDIMRAIIKAAIPPAAQ